jgi:hypothetical protein
MGLRGFIWETIKAKQWTNFFTSLKEKTLFRILYTVKLSLRNEGEIKTFFNIQELKEIITSRPVLQEMLKGTGDVAQ